MGPRAGLDVLETRNTSFSDGNRHMWIYIHGPTHTYTHTTHTHTHVSVCVKDLCLLISDLRKIPLAPDMPERNYGVGRGVSVQVEWDL